jgi:transposase
MQRLEADSASIVRSPRRFEVITGDPVRRWHEDAFKARLVVQSLDPDVCIADVARAAGVHPQLLYTWRRLARAGKLALPASDEMDFAALVIGDESPASLAPAGEAASISIEVDDVTVRLPAESAARRIAEIAAALREAL